MYYTFKLDCLKMSFIFANRSFIHLKTIHFINQEKLYNKHFFHAIAIEKRIPLKGGSIKYETSQGVKRDFTSLLKSNCRKIK